MRARKAEDILYAARRGEDLQAEKKAEQQPLTFAELADEYLERHAKLKKRRWKEDERILWVDLLPHWGKAQGEVHRAPGWKGTSNSPPRSDRRLLV